jgi:hypothetical protein
MSHTSPPSASPSKSSSHSASTAAFLAVSLLVPSSSSVVFSPGPLFFSRGKIRRTTESGIGVM